MNGLITRKNFADNSYGYVPAQPLNWSTMKTSKMKLPIFPQYIFKQKIIAIYAIEENPATRMVCSISCGAKPLKRWSSRTMPIA